MAVQYETSALESGDWFNPAPVTVRRTYGYPLQSRLDLWPKQNDHVSGGNQWHLENGVWLEGPDPFDDAAMDDALFPNRKKYLKIPYGKEDKWPWVQIKECRTLLVLKQIAAQWVEHIGTDTFVCACCGIVVDKPVKLMAHEPRCALYQRALEIIEWSNFVM